MEEAQHEADGVGLRAGSALIGALAAALGLVGLGRKSFWFDEAYDVVLARASWGHYLDVAFNHESSQLAYLVLLKPWLALAGDGELSARLPSVFFFGIAVSVFTWLACIVYGRRTGFVAGVLLAVDGYVVALAQQARTYSLALLLTVIATALLVAALEKGTMVRWALYALTASASIYTHFMAAGVLIAHVATVAAYRPAPDRRRVAAVSAAIGVCSLPALWFCVARDQGQIAWLPPLSVSAARGVLTESVDRNPALFIAAVLGIVVAASFSSTPRWSRALAVAWFVAPTLVLLGVSVFKSLLWSRYLIVAAPGIALCAALALTRIRRFVIAAGATAAILAIGGYRVAHWWSGPPLEDWRTADRMVAASGPTGDPTVVEPPDRAAGWSVYERRPLSRARLGRSTWLITGTLDELSSFERRLDLHVCQHRQLQGLVVARLASTC